MRWMWLIGGMAGALLSAGASVAETLTCNAFKDRLNTALLASGDKNAALVDFKLGFSNAVRGNRYNWETDGLAGTMNCGPSEQFEEFGIRVQFESKSTFADVLKGFVTMQGASICALARDNAPVCTEFGRGMLQQAIEQMGRSFNRGSRAPSGLSDRMLFHGANAELTSAPSLITFVIGPGRGLALDAERQLLDRPTQKPPG